MAVKVNLSDLLNGEDKALLEGIVKALVVDVLTSDVADVPLSAKQGKALKTLVDTKIAELLGDTTPQLGGALDCNGKTINKASVRQIADASGSGTVVFDYANGDMVQYTATGNITLAFSNFVTGQVCAMIIDAVNWGTYTITHPAGMLFSGGNAPAYTAVGTDRILITKDKDNVYTLTEIAKEIKA